MILRDFLSVEIETEKKEKSEEYSNIILANEDNITIRKKWKYIHRCNIP